VKEQFISFMLLPCYLLVKRGKKMFFFNPSFILAFEWKAYQDWELIAVGD